MPELITRVKGAICQARTAGGGQCDTRNDGDLCTECRAKGIVDVEYIESRGFYNVYTTESVRAAKLRSQS